MLSALVAVLTVPAIVPTIKPPTYKLPPTPTPPVTVSAPVAVVVAAVELVKIICPVLNVPYVALVKIEVPVDSTPAPYHSKYLVSLARPKNAFLSVPV